MVNVSATYPVILADTPANLKSAIAGEHEEWIKLYPEAAKIADQEGFKDVAESFRQVAEAEKEHEKRYQALKNNIDQGLVFKKAKPVKWRCRNCGRVIEAAEAPKICPTCSHEQAHFELMAENY